MSEEENRAETQNDWGIFLQRFHQQSPWAVLGLEEGADEQQIHKAYEERRSQSPPEDIHEVREAYFTLMDPLSREVAAHLVPGVNWDLESIFRATPAKKNYLGPRAWYRFISPDKKEKDQRRNKRR
jgi:curved DNA-binding protein CbpA